MPSPYEGHGGATQQPPSSEIRIISSSTASASPFNAMSPALSFGGSPSGPPPPPSAHRRVGMESPLLTPPPFAGYNYQHHVVSGYPSASAAFPGAGGDHLSSHHSVTSVHPDRSLPPTDISFPSAHLGVGMQGDFSHVTGGFGFVATGMTAAPVCPDHIRSNPDSFVHTPGLNGAASTPSNGHPPRFPDMAPIIDFYTDMDFPYGTTTSPLLMTDATRDVNRSQDTSTTYKIGFTQDPAGPSISKCQFGARVGGTVEICFENIDPQSIYQHRYILLCRIGTGKVYGLEICPSNSRTIRPFPLLLAIKDHQTHRIVSYIANPLLRGSLNGEPGNMKSNFDWYVSTSGWLGGGVVSSYPAALCFNDNFHRLTKKSGSQIRGLGLGEVPMAEHRVTSDSRNPPFCPPSIRDYILHQLVTLGFPNSLDWIASLPVLPTFSLSIIQQWILSLLWFMPHQRRQRRRPIPVRGKPTTPLPSLPTKGGIIHSFWWVRQGCRILFSLIARSSARGHPA